MIDFTKILSASLLALMLSGCGTTEPDAPKVVKEEPARMIDATLKSATISQAKNQLMAGCSSNNLLIKTDTKVVTCETKKPIPSRDRELTAAVRDEFATDIREVFEFTLTEQGGNIQIKANSFARFQSPVSVTSANLVKKRNLLDDQAISTLKSILDKAGATY